MFFTLPVLGTHSDFNRLSVVSAGTPKNLMKNSNGMLGGKKGVWAEI
jgi:hypothetical protein